MGLEIDSDIFKWLQAIHLVKEGKRTPSSAVQISDHATSKFFDGLYISYIVKILLKEKGHQESIARLQAIKQNSTPAIRLYNWNLLSQALKILGRPLDYGEKSKILNLQPESIQKIIRFLYGLRSIDETKDQSLQVQTSSVGQKSYKQASNIFEFLVISISNHFKLSVQHTLNLFLDDNKYLAHLLVKGVKNAYQPILSLIQDIGSHLPFIIESLFCVDQNQSVNFLFNAIKPCLISKSFDVAEKCLFLFRDIYETYIQKGVNATHASLWMQKQGISTFFFSIKRHDQLFQPTIAVLYAYLEDKIYQQLQPQDKSLLWNNDLQKISFFRQLITLGHSVFIAKFIESPAFAQWNKYCLKALKRNKNTQEMCLLMSIYQNLWINHQKFLQEHELSIPNAFISFLKNGAIAHSQIIFIQSTRTLFHLLVFLGLSKKSFAPLIYKTLVSVIAAQDQKERVEFLLMNFAECFETIPALPAAPLAESIVKHLQSFTSPSLIEMAKFVLTDPKLREQQAEDILQTLAKVVFEDIQYGSLAVEAMIPYLCGQAEQELLDYYCKAALGHFVSMSKELFRTVKQLKQDYEKYKNEESMKRGEASFLRNMNKYLIISNLVLFFQKLIFSSKLFKSLAEPMIFHTYLKLSKEMRKQHIAKILKPLLQSYYQDQNLQAKLKYYQHDLQQSIQSPLDSAELQQVSQVFQTPSPKRQKERPSTRQRKSIMKTQSHSSEKKVDQVELVRKQLQEIKKKRQIQKQKSFEILREQSVIIQKQQLYRSMVNEKRIIQFGKKYQLDYDYQNLLQFDSVHSQGTSLGLPNVKTINLKLEEQQSYAEDAQTFLLKYRKVWRFLFYKYSSFGAIKPKPEPLVEEKINMSEVWKILKDYQFDIVKREQSQILIRKVNEEMKRRTDPQNLTYLGFEQYLLQLSFFAYSRLGYPHVPPARQLALLLEQIRSITASKGGSTDIFDNPDQVYFQQTEVIRQFNKRLSQNSDYVLPEGYKKIRQSQLVYSYSINSSKGLKKSYSDVLEVLNEILWERMQMHILEPKTSKIQKCLARPALFQKLKEKMKDYSGGYMMPKRSVDLARLNKDVSPMKIEYHLLPNFSLGIKLGLASVDIKLRYIADEVAFWMDDVLDAVEAGKLKVTNKSKVKIQNQLIRRKRSEAYQQKLENIQHQKKEKIRAQTVKNNTKKYAEDKQAAETRRRQEQKKQKQVRKMKQQKQLKMKLQEFQQAKAKLQAKRRLAQEKREAEIPFKKKEKEEYRKNVQQYFKKKKDQLQQKQKTLKANREWDAKQEQEKKSRQITKKKKLQIEVFRKQEQVLQKIVQSRQSYEQIWRSPQIQEDFQDYRPRLKLLFDLLLRYEKSKISSTGIDEIGFNTLNFFALRTYISPFLMPKNILTLLFRSSVRQNKTGLNYIQFEEFLFKIAVKSKDILNKRKNGLDHTEYESQIPELPSLKSSPQLDKKKKSLTDDYALDAIGVENSTLKRLMDFIVLPFDKQEAQERFRTMLQNTSSLPTSLVLKQAQNFLDSIP